MNKRVLAAMMAAMMAVGMTACGSSQSSSDSSSSETSAAETTAATESTGSDEASAEDVTIRYYNYALSETDKAYWWENVIAEFESENPGITIETTAVDYNSMVTTLTNDLASGLTVDLIYGEISWIPSLVDAGFIQAPSGVLDPDFYSGYYDYVLDQFIYNGEVYGVPQYYTNSVIYVNTALVEAAGLSMDEFPDTLDGLKEWIETLNDYYKDDDSVSTIFGLTTAEVPATGSNINGIYTAFGGTLVNEDGTLADLTAEPNATAMSEMLDFYDYLISNGYTQENLKLKDYRASFGAQNVCMYVDSSWGYAGIVNVDANAADFTRAEALPSTMGTNGEGNSLVEANCFLFGAGLSDAQKSAVDKFIQYCTQNETTGGYINTLGLAFPAHEAMADCEISPVLEDAAKGVDHVVKQTMIPSQSSVQIELATMVLNYTVNGMSKEDAINNYVTQAEYYINQ